MKESLESSVAVGGARRLMRGAVLVGQNVPLEITDVEIPELSVGQVLVQIDYSGICGKQLEEISGRRGEDPYIPHLLGHEGSGTVVDVGPGVRKVKAGDAVVLHWMKGSGVDAMPAQFSSSGNKVNAGCVTTFSELTVASENRVTPIPKNFPRDVAALLGCAVTTGIGIVLNNLNLKPSESLAVFGAGGVGLNILQGARLVSAHPIVAVDIHDRKLDEARHFGATHVLNSNQKDLKGRLRQIAPEGFDAVVDVTGIAAVRELGYEVTHNRGTTVFAGVPHATDRITIDSFPLHFGRRVIGCHGGDTRPDVDIPRCIRLFQQGKLQLREQISHCFSLGEINDAIGTVQKGGAMRCLVSMRPKKE